jgi:hypothetical protein
MFRAAIGAIAIAGLAGCAGLLKADDEYYQATLSGAREMPPVASGGSGHAELRYNHKSQLLHWRVTHSGLSGAVTAAHFHGPAGPEQNAQPLIPLAGNLNAPPIDGQLRLTPEQYNQLESGQWYVDLHTARHPDGEIRGQLRHRPD